MTTATNTLGVAPSPLDGIRLSFGGVLRSEWIKLRSLRSTAWCLGLVVVLALAFSSLGATAIHLDQADQMPTASVQQLQVLLSTVGVTFAQLVAAVLGVLVITGEYSTGMIRSTFTAVPGRLGAYFAKLIVLAVTVFVVSIVSLGLAAVAVTAILSARGAHTDLFSSDVLLPLLGGAGYLVLITALAFASGAIIRNTGGGIATILGVLLVLPVVLSLVASLTQAVWLQNVALFLPNQAGGRLYAFHPNDAPQLQDGQWWLDATQGGLVLLAWAVVAVVVGAVLIKRRDV